MLGTNTILGNFGNPVYFISAVALNENKVVVADVHGYKETTLCDLSVEAYIIDGTTITQGIVDFSVISASEFSSLSMTALNENKLFVAYTYKHNTSSPYVLQSVIYQISQSSIDKGSTVLLNESSSYYYEGVSAVALSENKVFIAHGYDGYDEGISVHGYDEGRFLHGVLCTIDGMLITVENSAQLSTNQFSGKTISATALSENKVFIAHSCTTDSLLFGMLCTINEGSINVISDTPLNLESNSGDFISTVLLSANKVLIVHSYSSNYYLCKTACTVSENEIFIQTATLLSIDAGYAISATKVNENRLFIAHCVNKSELYYMLQSIIPEVQIFSDLLKQFAGVAKTSGNEGQTIKVITPIYESEGI